MLLLLTGILFIAPSSGDLYGQVVINEYSASNLDDFPDNYLAYEDWIELYNAGASAVDLSGFHLSDRETAPKKYEIPAGTTIPAGGFLRFWTSGRNLVGPAGNYHTSFKLKQTKTNPEFVVFSDQFGSIIESHQMQRTQLSHSRGRAQDGGATWAIFTTPTPNGTNNNTASFERYAAMPEMDQTAGFYSGGISVNITTTETNATIRYTTNGQAVGASSTAFSSAVNVGNTTVVKARVFSNNPAVLPSNLEWHTYLINEVHVLPVISISGSDLQNLANGNQQLRPHGTCEYFTAAGDMVTKGTGEFNSHGQDSWVHDQRSLDWITRDEMGINHALEAKLFPTSDRDEFQRVMFRAEGDDNYPGIDSSAHMRDMYTQTITDLANMHVDKRRASKIVLYIDGIYWGVTSLREKVDDPDYTKYYYGQDKYNIQMIMTWGNTWIEYGPSNTITQWNILYNYIVNQDMSNPTHFAYVDSLYEWRSLVDYTLINSYVVCSDWLNWNTAWWRGNDPSGTHRKWAYNMWDDDATFGHYINYTGIPSQTPDVDPCFPENLNNNFSDPEGHMTVLNNLRANPTFDQWYISRYVDLMNTYFSCDSMHQLLDSLVAVVDPEMNRHCVRWGGSYQQWSQNIQKLRDFVDTRCNFVSQGINGCYGLTGPYEVAFNVEPADAGHIQVNSTYLQQFPWKGDYHAGLPILLEAVEYDTTWIFDHWEVITHSVTPHDSIKNVELNITQADSVVAHFRIRNPVGRPEPVDEVKDIQVFPNPFTESTTIKVEGKVRATNLVVYDLLGKPVRQLTPTAMNTFKVDRTGLADGLYFFRLEDKDGRVLGNGKFVVE
ncbi:MAG: CotH kinase family protein [Bacteroidota bacterium]